MLLTFLCGWATQLVNKAGSGSMVAVSNCGVLTVVIRRQSTLMAVATY
jgi:hypothetical protein